MAVLAAAPLRDPCILADLEADSHAGEIEEHVAERVALATAFELHDLMVGPGLEPARLVVKPLASEVLLGREPCDLSVGDEACGVVETAPTPDRHPNAHDHALGLGHELHQHRPGTLRDIRPEECVLAAVARRAKLGKHEQRHPLSARLPKDRLDAPLVAGPIERRLIQRRGRDLDGDHA
jgi:hypothetical protein